MRPEPTNPLPDAVRTMWLLEAALSVLLILLVAAALAMGFDALGPWLALPAVAAGLAYVVLVPPMRYRRYRWELHEEELDLIAGVLRVTRTIVPITRIQHVSVERTGWTNLFGLVRLHVHTAAGRTTIPGLEPPVADDVRDRILARLRTPDDL